MIQEQLINWLLEGDVSIQYQVWRDLLGKEKTELQNRIAENTSDTLLMSRRKDSLATLTQKITEEERNTLDLQENANKTASALKKIDDDFLSNGITVPSVKQIDAGPSQGSMMAS